jgi:hypothetical protein
VRAQGLHEAIESLQREVQVDSLADLLEWIHVPAVAGLWVDGYDALAHLKGRRLDILVRTFLEATIGEGSRRFHVSRWLANCDRLLKNATDDSSLFYSTLAMTVGGLHCLRSMFDLSMAGEEVPIINDYVMLALSPAYRACRFEAYNLGVTLHVDLNSDRGSFSPADRRVVLGRSFVCPGTTKVLQHYNVLHDLSHITLFGDAYRTPPKSLPTELLLLLMEECCCSVDLLIISELNRFAEGLRVRQEFRSIEGRVPTGFETTKSAAQLAAEDKVLFVRMQRALKSLSVQRLVEYSDSSNLRKSATRYLEPVDSDVRRLVDNWVSPGARDMHVKESVALANCFHAVLNSTDAKTDQIERSKNTSNLELRLGGDVYGLPMSTPMPALRNSRLKMMAAAEAQRLA